MTDRIPLDELNSDQYDALHAELDRLTAELADYDERAEQQKQRADEAEQHLRNIAQGGPRADAVQAEIGEMIRQTHDLRDQLRRAEAELADRDAAESADAAAGSYASGQATLTITVTAPNPVHAVRWAGHVRDLVHAEFDRSMRLHSFIELEPGGSARTTPDNPAASENTPNNPLEEQLRAAIESELYEYRERAMWWPEGAITGEIARLATRGALEALGQQPDAEQPRTTVNNPAGA